MYIPSLIPLAFDFSQVSSFFTNLSSIFSSCFDIIEGNPALTVIICAAVGLPILGAVISMFKGK